MTSSKRILTLSLTLLSIVGYGFFVFAAAPTGGYIPGQTNDPACAPGDIDCAVNLSVVTNTTYTWIGVNTGQNSGSTDNTVFVGIGAGDGATNAFYSNFIGTGAGLNAINANNSNFLGEGAGCDATNADNANFFGKQAGCYATNANNSNFFGYRSGYSATNADHSTFFGDEAGNAASSAYSSVFIGASTGQLAVNAYQSNFFGREAGYQATNASNSTFMGYQAGYQATDASGSFFAGNQAGYAAQSASDSLIVGNLAGYNASNTPDFLGASHNPYGVIGNVTFVGPYAGFDAAGAAFSNFIGVNAGFQATNSFASTFIGYFAGLQATNAATSVFLGNTSGLTATNASRAVFVGNGAGSQATNARSSVFIGNVSGEGAAEAQKSVFIGTGSGRQATGAFQSVFLGDNSGNGANSAPFGTFLGFDSGNGATRASSSVFIGHNAGWGSEYASNAIFIGQNSGIDDSINNSRMTVAYSGASGSFQVGELVTNTTTGRSFYIFADSGSVIEADGVDAYSLNPGDTLLGDVSGVTATVMGAVSGTYSILIGENTRTGGYVNSIALGTSAANTAAKQFMIGSSAFPIDEMYLSGSGGTNCITTAGVGMACSSDVRLKTNITDLSQSILDNLTKVRTVTYNWNQDPYGKRMVGFLAQDLEQYFPELVNTDSQGMKSVYYSQMTPILVEAIRELNIKLATIETRASELTPTMKESLVQWFANTANGITTIVADTFSGRRVQVTELCVGTTCLNQSQVDQILQSVGSTPSYTVPDSSSSSDSGSNNSSNADNSGASDNSGVDVSSTSSAQTEGEVVEEVSDQSPEVVISPEVPAENNSPVPSSENTPI